MESLIPIIDFGQVCIEPADNDCFSENNMQQLAEELQKAFRTVGFAYIKNHGIPSEKVDLVQACSMIIFQKSRSYIDSVQSHRFKT